MISYNSVQWLDVLVKIVTFPCFSELLRLKGGDLHFFGLKKLDIFKRKTDERA